MAIPSVNSYKFKIAAPYQTVFDTKGTQGLNPGTLHSFWAGTVNAGAAPTTAAACDRSLAGASGQLNSSGVQRLAQVIASTGDTQPVYLWVCDRLSHQGGLSGTTTGAQTTNLPTAALTRYTDGKGVMAALEIYTAIGGTPVDASMVYDNDAGASGQTSQSVTFGGGTAQNAFRMVIVPLASGDKGVKKVSSVTLSASTGTAGNFGVTLFKPLFVAPIMNFGSQQVEIDGLFGGGHLPQIVDGACLFYVFVTQQSFPALLSMALRFVEE